MYWHVGTTIVNQCDRRRGKLLNTFMRRATLCRNSCTLKSKQPIQLLDARIHLDCGPVDVQRGRCRWVMVMAEGLGGIGGLGAQTGDWSWVCVKRWYKTERLNILNSRKWPLWVLSKYEVAAGMGGGEGITQLVWRTKPSQPWSPLLRFGSWVLNIKVLLSVIVVYL